MDWISSFDDPCRHGPGCWPEQAAGSDADVFDGWVETPEGETAEQAEGGSDDATDDVVEASTDDASTDEDEAHQQG